MILRAFLALVIFLIVVLMLWKILSKVFISPPQPQKVEPLPSSITELKILRKELEDKLELLSNKKEIADIKEQINKVNSKLADHA